MKSKQLQKGIKQLMEEGVAQMFIKEDNGRKIIGTVGALQFDVLQYRLEHEYGAKCLYEQMSMHKACWIDAEDQTKLKEFVQRRKNNIARDIEGNFVFMAESRYMLQSAQDNHPEVQFYFSSERK